MKKKRMKKLVLARETVKNLDVLQIGPVQGGTDILSYYCGPSYTQACTTIRPKSPPTQ